MKSWYIKLSAHFFMLGSPAIGALAAIQFSPWIGFILFLLSNAFGIYLHKVAKKRSTVIMDQANT